MIVQVGQILKLDQYSLEEKFDDISLPEGIHLEDGIHLKAQIGHGECNEIYLKGQINATVTLQCVICLDYFKEDYTISFEETYLPENLNQVFADNEERNIKELDVFFYKDNHIDTKEIARDILLANIPPYPVCKKCRESE